MFISNFKSGTLDEWGLSYEEVVGPQPAHHLCGGHQLRHRGHRRRSRGRRPQRPGRRWADQHDRRRRRADHSPIGVTICDHIACLNLVGGISAALFARERTGRGQRIDVSLLGGQVWAQASEITATLLTGAGAGPIEPRAPAHRRRVRRVPHRRWMARDRRRRRAGPRPLLRADRRAELVEQYPEPLYFGDTKRAVFAALAEPSRRGPPRTGANCSPSTASATPRCALTPTSSPTRDIWANGYLTRTADGDPVVASAVRFSDTPARTGEIAPELGQHTEEVLLEAGFTLGRHRRAPRRCRDLTRNSPENGADVALSATSAPFSVGAGRVVLAQLDG